MLFILMLVGFAHAKDLSRHVINGTIEYTGRAEASSEDSAVFLAEQQAIKGIVTECSIADKNIKIWGLEDGKTDHGWEATAKADIDYEDCVNAQNAKGNEKKDLINAKLAKDQEVYDKYLKSQLEPDNSLLSKIEKLFKNSDDQLKDIKNELNRINRAPASEIVIKEMPEREVIQKSDCRREYRIMMHQAEMEAQKNYPPGNLGQGEAAYYFGEAQKVLRDCKIDIGK